ncbi:hypothetical protein [Streptomyces sp. DH12]|uniref:hypothetical protein n=1 Tax=Streptomyces sp. DH12 TaxID=2857010 RepID=UPI001E46AAC1|nr:hypothetical protein [Streptomyces sp. DH12]
MTTKTPRSRKPVRATTAALGAALLTVAVAKARRRGARTTDGRPHRAEDPATTPPQDDSAPGHRAAGELDDVRVVAPGTPPSPVVPPPTATPPLPHPPAQPPGAQEPPAAQESAEPPAAQEQQEQQEPPDRPADPTPPAPPADPEAPHHRA